MTAEAPAAPPPLAPAAGSACGLATARIDARAPIRALQRSARPRRPADLTREELRRQIERPGVPLLIQIGASWCGPSRAMAVEFRRAARRLEGEVCAYKADAGRQRDVAADLGVCAVPALVLLRDGQVIARQTGAMRKAQIVAWAKSMLGEVGAPPPSRG